MKQKKVRDSMTESEAIEKLKNMRLFMQIEDEKNECKFTEDDYKANDMAIQALEKQIPKKPIRHTAWENFKCPACGSAEIVQYDTEYREYDKDCKFEYCSDCGQKLDWGDEE